MSQFPVDVKITLPGEPALRTALSRFAQGITNFTPFWTDYFVPQWYAMMARQYESEGAATGERWAPLTEAYAAWKQAHFAGQPIGVLSGDTRASLTSEHAPHAILNISRDRFEVGTDLPYPIFLQMGTGRRGAGSGRRKYRDYRHGESHGMVARPPLRVNAEYMRQVGKMLQKYCVDMLKAERESGE